MKRVIHPQQNAPIEVFPFITSLHREVIIRHLDDESQNIELSPHEALELAEVIRVTAISVLVNDTNNPND